MRSSAELVEAQAVNQTWMDGYNAPAKRTAVEWHTLLKQHLGHVGEGAIVRAPFFCDYGYNIHLAAGVFLNFGCVILDGAEVSIGEGTQIGPAVQIFSASEPDRPIVIGRNAWIGGGAVILPGVRIGDNAVVAAGSVVARDVAAGVIVSGNPARPTRF
jgi:maltose O-acetyltransferase